MIKINKMSFLSISKIFLVLLIFSININGANFFRTKELFFVALLLTGCIFADYSKIKPLVIMLLIYFSSLLFNLLVSGSNVDLTNGLYFSLGFFYLYLLVFNKDQYRNVSIEAYLLSAKVVAISIIVIWIVCFTWNEIKWQLITYFESVENKNVAFIFMIRSRKLLDWWVPGVYYSTAPCMIPALAYYLSKSIKNNRNVDKLSCLILSLGLIFTAARANLLAVFILFFIYLMVINYLKRRIIISIFFSLIAFLGSLLVFYLFISDTNEGSLALKALHKVAYEREFASDSLRTIIFGWGAGSSFYTAGFNEYTMLTELTLYETIRRYGLISTLLIFAFIWIPPILESCRKGFKLNQVYLGVALIVYILVASTNPFLLGSIGFCALFFFSLIINSSVYNK